MISIASMPTINFPTQQPLPSNQGNKNYHFSLRNFIKSFQNYKPSAGNGGYINYYGRGNKPLQTQRLKSIIIYLSQFLWVMNSERAQPGWGQLGLSTGILIVDTICDMVPRASISRAREPGGNHITFYELALEVKKLHFHCTAFLETVTKVYPGVRGGDIDPTFQLRCVKVIAREMGYVYTIPKR